MLVLLNLFNVFSLFSGGIFISSTGFAFSISLSYEFVTASATLFPKNSPVSWTTFLEAVFKESISVSNSCFYIFLQMIKI